jgi:hypothetical protein
VHQNYPEQNFDSEKSTIEAFRKAGVARIVYRLTGQPNHRILPWLASWCGWISKIQPTACSYPRSTYSLEYKPMASCTNGPASAAIAFSPSIVPP